MGNKFEIAEDKKQELLKEIKRYKKTPGPLMPILHEAQRIFGCIPVEVQKIVSLETGVSIAEINGVVTFYSSFTLSPKGEHIVGVCLGTPCYVRGSQTILDAVKSELGVNVDETTEDGFFTLEAIRCIGTCGMAPVMSIDENVYGEINVTKAQKLIREARSK
ncbi:NAD(P)H-dependent oxidoreductase subunit E [Candidatus Izimaplasma bacterium ZiA1]|uniref:NADH-quinone oxidoreductase subunit NuoE family protein n=1 Tax=Candidatus Izimoplasma sp. ZiA1 TaxID=2024899 RepID=UPI000BAA5CC9|nr:NAD(P)H-dependent oxidoreductase subunit E [Candidatus Izimaplasma bacterium ZiA1]